MRARSSAFSPQSAITRHAGDRARSARASGSTDVVGLTAWQCRELLSSGEVSAGELERAGGELIFEPASTVLETGAQVIAVTAAEER